MTNVLLINNVHYMAKSLQPLSILDFCRISRRKNAQTNVELKQMTMLIRYNIFVRIIRMEIYVFL